MRPGIAEADDVGHGVAVHIGERARIAVEADPAGVLAELLNRELQRRNPAFRGEWVASSLTLLAMTARRGTVRARFTPAPFLQ